MNCNQHNCLFDLLWRLVSGGRAAAGQTARCGIPRTILPAMTCGAADKDVAEKFGLGGVGWWGPLGLRLSPIRSAEYDVRRMSLGPGIS